MGMLCVSFTHPTHNAAARHRALPSMPDSVPSPSPLPAELLYDKLELSSLGLSQAAFSSAFRGYEKLTQSGLLNNEDILSICDFSKSSAEKRLFIIDLASEEVLVHTYVAHGKNSGGEFASRFSNTPESLQSSLGFYVTAETYTGKHGLSLRLKGVDGRFNSNAYGRTIVIHGADYVNEGRVKAGGYMGRSWGCPAVSRQEAPGIISLIKNGTCFFVYYPSDEYLNESKILND